MSQEPQVSIIVPVYNANYFLDKCLNSLIRQTFNNIEIILINDGSTDNSLNTCENWKKKDSRIKLFDKKNGGVSSARNLGIKVANGKYVCFVDADDWMPCTAIESLLNCILENSSDFCFGAAKGIGVAKSEYYGLGEIINTNVNDFQKFLEYTKILRSELGPWGKLFDLEIIKGNNIFFEENIAYGEDRIFIWTYLKYCNKVSMISEIVYFYSQLNMLRACGRYYEKTNIWLSRGIEKYVALFPDSFDDDSYLQKVALLQFDVTLRHYAEHINNRNLLNQKINESIACFERYLVKFSNDIQRETCLKNCDSRIRNTYSAYFDNYDIGLLIENIQKYVNANRIPAARIKLRNVATKVKRIMVYKIFK